MNKQDAILQHKIRDNIERSIASCSPYWSNFLDLNGQALARTALDSLTDDDFKMLLWGGYENAERKMLIVLPNFLTLEDVSPITLLRATQRGSFKTLEHRQYLGSLLSLGLDRSRVGDILVGESSVDILVSTKIANYIKDNFFRVGNTYITLEEIPISEIQLGSSMTKTIKATVPSIRLDALVSTCFKLSRTRAEESIRSGLIFVNDRQVIKKDFSPSLGSKITFRHKGRCKLVEIGNPTKKGRIPILYEISKG